MRGAAASNRGSRGSWTVLALGWIEVIGAAVGIVLGSLLHFTYELSGSLTAVGLVSAVNESPWEHLKLFVVPVLAYTVVEGRFVSDTARLLWTKLVQCVFGIVAIEAFFYTYTGALGVENPVVDILSFVVAMAGGYWISHRMLRSRRPAPVPSLVSAVLIAALVGFFLLATFSPPHLPVFRDHNTGRYGIG